ncbi:MAG: gas vesicle protein K [Chloroflexi bacterium]|nr:gas vesicle protein K [Chloroflexota bacterium]
MELDRRLHGDLAALSEFARELTQLRDRPPDGLRPLRSAAIEPGDRGQAAYTSGRINADPDTVEQGLAKLVLTLIEFIRQLLERQAMRRMEAGSLTDDEIERMGETFLRLERRMEELKAAFGLENEELNLSLGPLGNLLPEE